METTAPEAFAAKLPSSPTRYEVINEGVNSSNACQLLNGTDGKHPGWDAQMASSKANVVIINHAINHQGSDVETYKSCLRGLAQRAKTSGKKVVFETPNPIASGITEYVQAMKEVAAQQNLPVIDQHTYLMNRYNNNTSQIAPDGLHPSDAVYIVKGEYAAEVFKALGL